MKFQPEITIQVEIYGVPAESPSGYTRSVIFYINNCNVNLMAL